MDISFVHTFLGFDFGSKNIGVAVGQMITKTATPLSILKAIDGIPNWSDIEKLLQEWKPAAVIVGIPINMDGSDSLISLRARKFGNRIKGRFNVPFIGVDERLSTFEAKQMSLDLGLKQGLVDSLAAKLILESWMKNSQMEM